MDMKRFAVCNNTDPRTCFDASKAQILTGRWGRSRHLLYTSDNRASAPKAPCTTREKGPSKRHSPFSAPGLESGSLEFVNAVAAEVAEDSMMDKAVGWSMAVGCI